MVFLSERLRGSHKPLVLMGSEVPFHFARALGDRDRRAASGTACMPLTEEWGASRLASRADCQAVSRAS